MGAKRSEQMHSQNDFSEIVKKAFNRGINDHGVTVEQLLEELKSDLRKMKAN